MGSHGDSADRLRLHHRPVFCSYPRDAGGRSRVFSRRAALPRPFPDLLRRHGAGDFDLGIPLGASLPLGRRLYGDRGSDARGKANAVARGGGGPRPHRNIRFLRRAVSSRIEAQARANIDPTGNLEQPDQPKERRMAKSDKPNILIIWGDDIGYWNISHYSRGMMGYQTPNIDRIAQEGGTFTDWYGQQSCTAGRACFITGQNPIRTGLTKVGLPGATIGLHAEDPTIAEMLKPLGYATGQFGKNHLGDRNEYLPTVHGFEEFLGNLYHLNAEEDPEDPDYPKDPRFIARFSPRGVLKCIATDTDDPTVDPRFGRVGKQKIEDTGPLTRKRMETIDDETTEAAIYFIQRQVKAGKPFFVWMNTTRMHLYTHVRPSMRGQSGMPDNEYGDGMVEHDGDVGKLLKALDDLGAANDTIVVYTTDNGPHMNGWPDGAMTPFRSEKDTNWEGAFRVPAMVRWPGHIKPGSIANDIFSGHDWFPTLLAVAGDSGVKDRLLAGWQIGGRT